MVRVLHNSPAPLGLEGSWADCYLGQILLLSPRARALATLLCMDVLTALWTASPFSTLGVLGVLEVSPCPPVPVPHTWSSLLPELSQQAPRKHGLLPASGPRMPCVPSGNRPYSGRPAVVYSPTPTKCLLSLMMTPPPGSLPGLLRPPDPQPWVLVNPGVLLLRPNGMICAISSFILQIFTEHLQCSGHCSKCWDMAVDQLRCPGWRKTGIPLNAGLQHTGLSFPRTSRSVAGGCGCSGGVRAVQSRGLSFMSPVVCHSSRPHTCLVKEGRRGRRWCLPLVLLLEPQRASYSLARVVP